MELINGETEKLKKGTWSPEEDQKLLAYVKRYGIWNWSLMPKAAGLSRSGKSCRLRWMNHLRPTIKRERFNIEEVELILHLHQLLGNKWSKIAEKLPGRTDNDINNFWNTHLRKQVGSSTKTVPDRANRRGNDPKRVKLRNNNTGETENKVSLPLFIPEAPENPIAESFSFSEGNNGSTEGNYCLESSCSTSEMEDCHVEGNTLTESLLMEDWNEALNRLCTNFEESDLRLQSQLAIQESYFHDDMNSYWFDLFFESYRMGEAF